MEKIIQHEKYGQIKYTESFWTGSAGVEINGVVLNKTGKKTFEYQDGETQIPIQAKGNLLTGVKMEIGQDTIVIRESAKWYEYALSAFIFIFILVWGNVVALCELLPLVGGAIGGAISAFFGMMNLFTMRLVSKPYFKILIFLAYFAATVIVCWGIGLAIISAAK